MSSAFRLACIQVNAGDDLAYNIDAATDLARAARSEGADFIAFPECVSMMAYGRRAVLAAAQSPEKHPALTAFRTLAAETGAWLLAGTLSIRLAGDKVANRSYLIDGNGDIAATYDKIHMFDVDLGNGEVYRESGTYKPGARAVLADTPWGVLGMTVCYDLRFPAIYRDLAQAGATLLSVPSAFTRPTGEAHWEVLLRARAIENGAYVFAPAQCGQHPGDRATWGHSLIVDPWGRVLADGGEEPGYIIAEIDPARVAEVRRSLPSLDHDRPFDSPAIYPRGSTGGSES
jgi:predicted amidohydrolase